MSRSYRQSYRIQGKGFNWKQEYEYTANVKKLKKWMRKNGYTRDSLTELVGIGLDKARFVYAVGNYTLYEAKKLAVMTGMSLYDFIDIFLADIYPVTKGDFDEI